MAPQVRVRNWGPENPGSGVIVGREGQWSASAGGGVSVLGPSSVPWAAQPNPGSRAWHPAADPEKR